MSAEYQYEEWMSYYHDLGCHICRSYFIPYVSKDKIAPADPIGHSKSGFLTLLQCRFCGTHWIRNADARGLENEPATLEEVISTFDFQGPLIMPCNQENALRDVTVFCRSLFPNIRISPFDVVQNQPLNAKIKDNIPDIPDQWISDISNTIEIVLNNHGYTSESGTQVFTDLTLLQFGLILLPHNLKIRIMVSRIYPVATMVMCDQSGKSMHSDERLINRFGYDAGVALERFSDNIFWSIHPKITDIRYCFYRQRNAVLRKTVRWGLFGRKTVSDCLFGMRTF